MAGHSKWANIKHRKAAQDAKRGKLWTKLIREITVAARLGGGEADDNPRLRAAIDKALGANIPKDTIEKAISRGTGGQDGSDVEELVYEGYGPGGVAILVEAMTDNRNRTVAEVRHTFSKYGGNLGTDGSVAYLFAKKGIIGFAPGVDEEQLMELALDVGAEDIDSEDDGSMSVIIAPEGFAPMIEALNKAGLEAEHADVSMVPSTTSACDHETAEQVIRLLEALEDLDDVQDVHSNGDFPDSVMADV